MPIDTPFQVLQKEKAAFKKIDEILESDIVDEDGKTRVIESLGIQREDADYWTIAKLTNDEKTQFLLDQITEIARTSRDRSEMLNLIAENRLIVNGKQIAADGVITEMFNRNLITKAERNLLKDLEFTRENGELVVKPTGRGRGASIKKITPVKPSKAAFVPLSIAGGGRTAKIGISKEEFEKIKL